MAEAKDTAVWNYAEQHHLAIVTKDADFRLRSFLEGYPPKIIWIALGNKSTSAIEDLLRRRRSEIESFLTDELASFLSLS